MLRDSLRSYTSSHHQRIEQTLDLPSSVRCTADLEQLLARFYGFYLPHEAQLLSHASALDAYGVELASRMKSGKLRSDLLCLGMSEGAIGALPICIDLPELRTASHALGSLYVLEGSTLGSQVIARDLQQRIELNIAPAMQFFRGYGSRTGAMWRSFVSALDAAQLQPESVEAAHEGAAQTFDRLERWMAARYIPARRTCSGGRLFSQGLDII
jgi:heme oxygenase (biliverdin-IX-beta and delta-forming)